MESFDLHSQIFLNIVSVAQEMYSICANFLLQTSAEKVTYQNFNVSFPLQVFGCRKKMSAIAILDYSGAEALFKQMEQCAEEGRSEWELNNKEVILYLCSLS